jgi:hypothetical protein
MRSDVVVFVSSLEDVDTICSHGLSVNGRFFEAQCLVNIPKKLTFGVFSLEMTMLFTLKAGDIVVYENAIILFLKRYIEKCRDLILR